jgi:hypothetical protein
MTLTKLTHPLFDGVERLFTRGHHLEKFIGFSARIVNTISAVKHVFFLATFTYRALEAVAWSSARYGKAALAVNVFRFKVVFVFLRPFFGDFFPHFVIVFLRGDVSVAVRAD